MSNRQLLQGGAPLPPDGATRKSLARFPCVHLSQKQLPSESVEPILIFRKRTEEVGTHDTRQGA